MSIVCLYGITACDTCRKARRWLDEAGIDYRFVDLRREAVAPERLAQWRNALGDARLINRRSKTWRDLDAEARAAVEQDPVSALASRPTLAKRPILETSDTVLAGFSAEHYAALFSQRGTT